MTAETRTCAPGAPGRAYCGRKPKTTEPKWARVTCGDCHAAHRADQQAGEN